MMENCSRELSKFLYIATFDNFQVFPPKCKCHNDVLLFRCLFQEVKVEILCVN